MTTVKTKNVCCICDEKLNKSKRICIECQSCEFQACRTCCETFILSIPEPKCMNTKCGKTWTREFMVNSFTHVFMNNSFKEHKKNVFFEKEKALLPATQIIAEETLARENYTKANKIFYEFNTNTTNMNNIILSINKDKDFNINENEFENMKIVYEKLKSKTQLLQIKNDEYFMKYKSIRLRASDDKKEVVKKQFIRHCGDSECRGFLTDNWNCGLCNKSTCNKCHLINQCKGHVCLESDIATVKLLANDSKPCPKCATFIFKIDGCDQMWCTQCHTAFSWKSGLIETNIHNPHYYEWMRRNGGLNRNPMDIQCGRELNNHLANDFIPYRDLLLEMDLDLFNIIRSSLHIHYVERSKYIVHNFFINVLDNEKLRVDYMLNRIDEVKFKTLVLRRYNQYEKHKEIYDILSMFIQSITDIIYRLKDELCKSIKSKNKNGYMSIPLEMNELIQYTNMCLKSVSDNFNSVCLKIEMKPKSNIELITLKNK